VALLLLAIVLIASLIMIPFGLPGLWVMLGAALIYAYSGGGAAIGTATLVLVGILAVIAEVIEFVLSARYVRIYGGSRRGAWGAIIGGTIGAIMGVPVPIVGSLVGAFAGSFAGALIAELGAGAGKRDASRAAFGALVGRAVAAAMKVAIGLVIAVWIFSAAWS
jgi:uncharacterized protein YqgC (DUF456 family)